MTDAEHAVREAAARVPADVCARFETATQLRDDDRQVVIELARQALAGLQPRTASEPAPPVPVAKSSALAEATAPPGPHQSATSHGHERASDAAPADRS